MLNLPKINMEQLGSCKTVLQSFNMLHFRHTVNLKTPILLKLTPWKKIIGFLTAFLIHTFRAVSNQEKWSFFQSEMQNTSHLF